MGATRAMLDWAATYGLGNLLSILIAIAFWQVLNFVLKESSKRDHELATIVNESIKLLSESINNNTKMVMSHDQRAQDFYASVRESDNYQRREHEKIIDSIEAVSKKVSG